MKFTALGLAGAFRVEPESHGDERGFFARMWCAKEFAAHGLRADFVQSSMSSNRLRGTLRGMHFQASPHGETKLVTCIRGAALDVIVDLREESSTYRKWEAFELTAENRHAIYIPEGFAHGFQTLSDETELLYCISGYYEAGAARGVRWNDPALGIAWPILPPKVISPKDEQLPLIA